MLVKLVGYVFAQHDFEGIAQVFAPGRIGSMVDLDHCRSEHTKQEQHEYDADDDAENCEHF